MVCLANIIVLPIMAWCWQYLTQLVFVIQLYYCLLQLSSWCVIINSNLIKPALSLPGTGLIQALEGGVPKLVLRCLVSETVGYNVFFITGRANTFLETATEYEKPFNNKSFITKSMNLNGKSLLPLNIRVVTLATQSVSTITLIGIVKHILLTAYTH